MPSMPEKLFAKVAQAKKSTRFEALVKLMEVWNFETTYGESGDIAIFRHRVYPVQTTAAKPHHGPVKPVYVRHCLNAIEQVQLHEEQGDA